MIYPVSSNSYRAIRVRQQDDGKKPSAQSQEPPAKKTVVSGKQAVKSQPAKMSAEELENFRLFRQLGVEIRPGVYAIMRKKWFDLYDSYAGNNRVIDSKADFHWYRQGKLYKITPGYSELETMRKENNFAFKNYAHIKIFTKADFLEIFDRAAQKKTANERKLAIKNGLDPDDYVIWGQAKAWYGSKENPRLPAEFLTYNELTKELWEAAKAGKGIFRTDSKGRVIAPAPGDGEDIETLIKRSNDNAAKSRTLLPEELEKDYAALPAGFKNLDAPYGAQFGDFVIDQKDWQDAIEKITAAPEKGLIGQQLTWFIEGNSLNPGAFASYVIDNIKRAGGKIANGTPISDIMHRPDIRMTAQQLFALHKTYAQSMMPEAEQIEENEMQAYGILGVKESLDEQALEDRGLQPLFAPRPKEKSEELK